jgi:hypothetical protein
MRISEKLEGLLQDLEDWIRSAREANDGQDHEEIKFISFNLWSVLVILAETGNHLDSMRQE